MVNYKCYVTYLIKYLSLYLNTNDVEYLRIVIKVLFNHELIKQVFSTQSTALISKQLQIACLKTVLSRLIFFLHLLIFSLLLACIFGYKQSDRGVLLRI